MKFSFQARENVGYLMTWFIRQGGALVDLTGWTFKATLTNGAGASLTLNMAANAGSEGFYITNGPTGALQVYILPATLQGLNLSGDYELKGDLLGTPPGAPRRLVADLTVAVSEGVTA